MKGYHIINNNINISHINKLPTRIKIEKQFSEELLYANNDSIGLLQIIESNSQSKRYNYTDSICIQNNCINKAINSKYCFDHKCIWNGCEDKKINNSYCETHNIKTPEEKSVDSEIRSLYNNSEDDLFSSQQKLLKRKTILWWPIWKWKWWQFLLIPIALAIVAAVFWFLYWSFIGLFASQYALEWAAFQYKGLIEGIWAVLVILGILTPIIVAIIEANSLY